LSLAHLHLCRYYFVWQIKAPLDGSIYPHHHHQLNRKSYFNLQCLKILASFDTAFANRIQQNMGNCSTPPVIFCSLIRARACKQWPEYLHPRTHHSTPFQPSSAQPETEPIRIPASRQPGILVTRWYPGARTVVMKKGQQLAVAFGIVPARHGFTFMHMQFFIFLPYILPSTNLFAAAIPIPRCQDAGRWYSGYCCGCNFG